LQGKEAGGAGVSSVLLIYPFFRPFPDLSIFRQPPLGVGYIAASLREAGHRVEILDCTFLGRKQAMARARASGADVAGISCMVSMQEDCLRFARVLRSRTRLLVAGGPLPTISPAEFLPDFDVVVRGEGEITMREVVDAHSRRRELEAVPGLALLRGGRLVFTGERPFARDLDALPFPARDLLPNARYIRHGRRRFGQATATVMSTRGCPYACEFCSNVIFGRSYREHSPGRVVDEIEDALSLGYDRISFADDLFTARPERVRAVCSEIGRRGLVFPWECLGRVDTLDYPTAREMRRAGCRRIFFGIESANDGILALMNKKTTRAQAQAAVEIARRAGIRVGAFFILFYPGETDATVLETLRFATRLPLDYLGLTMPYPLPGTALLERVKDRRTREWRPRETRLLNHVLTFDADFTEVKMWFGILKGHVQFGMRNALGRPGLPLVSLFEKATDRLLTLLKQAAPRLSRWTRCR
jgi:anaerobic magnesium-protoporphyrin IX monomethyl ester cyclase